MRDGIMNVTRSLREKQHYLAGAISPAAVLGHRPAGQKPRGRSADAQLRIGLRRPEALELVEHVAELSEFLGTEPGIDQMAPVAIEEIVKAQAKRCTLGRHLDPDRSTVVQRTLLHQISRLDHLLQVVRDVGAEVIPPQRQFADRELVAADTVEDQALDVVDVLDAQAIKFELQHVERLTVKAFDYVDSFIISSHGFSPDTPIIDALKNTLA